MSDTTVVLDDAEYDLDAAAAEAAKQPLRFRWKGQPWTLRHISTLDWRVVELANAGDMEAIRKAMRYGLGDEQADRFDAVEQDMDAMTLLFRQWLKHAGLGEGESSASAASSASTEKQSRPASARTTRASTSASSGKARSRRGSSSST